MERYKIRWVYNHYEAYLHGQFICSGDNKEEIVSELKNYESED